jgi:hypothetical protein
LAESAVGRGFVMRVMFTTYVLSILAGLVLYIAIGVLGR